MSTPASAAPEPIGAEPTGAGPAAARPVRAQPPAASARAVEDRGWVDFAKGVAIVLVVLYHSSLFLNELGLAGSTTRIRSLLLFIPMPVFFFIAGLTVRRMHTWSFPDLWRRRLLTFVYLYVLWSVIRVAFYLLVPHLRGSETDPLNPLNLLLLPVWPTSSYWFIWALAIFTLIAWLLRRVPGWVQIAAAGVLALVSTTPGLLDANNVGWDRVMQNLVFFLAAVFLPRVTYRLAARVRVWHAVVLVGAYSAVAVAVVAFHATRIPGVVLVESAIAVAATIAASALLTRVRWLGFVSSLGRHSFQIYLLHLFVVAIVLWAVSPIADYSLLLRSANALPFLLAAAALAISVLLFRLLRRFSWLWVSPFRTSGAARRRGRLVRARQRAGSRRAARRPPPTGVAVPAPPPAAPIPAASDGPPPRGNAP